jgi:hypothetical protein
VTTIPAPAPGSPGPSPVARATSAGAPGAPEHAWMLVAPWWHWPTEGGHGRTTAPVFQKYETPDLVNTFLADPQLRLQFIPASDQVVEVDPAPSRFAVPTRTLTDTRKLYLDTHHRHYLVACELHCDATGFPMVTRDQVCQAGFVVWRGTKTTHPPPPPPPPPEPLLHHQRRAARVQLRRLAAARNRLAAIEAQVAIHQGRGHRVRMAQLEGKRHAAANLVAEHQAAVAGWAAELGVGRQLQGWLPQGKDGVGNYVDLPACPGAPGSTPAPPSPLAGVGRWAAVDETPDEITELTYPLHPLVADPTQPASDAVGSTVYFGLVPTGSADVDATGRARFDEDTVYEIRCFVRRHKPECPRSGPQCHCPITWSDPTEGYQVAPHFDLQGTSNKPVTVQMPDLHQLQSDAMSLPPGSTAGVIIKAPQSLMPSGSSFPPGGSSGQQLEICSFAIPLITIVATFVFKLFLPIVILAFQLWFMLLLKFCIPPEVDAAGGLGLALEAIPPSVDVSLSVAASFDATYGADIDAGINSLFGGISNSQGSPASQFNATTPSPLDKLRLAKMLLGGQVDPVGPGDLLFAPRVERWQAVP